jgi:hypothetical protein
MIFSVGRKTSKPDQRNRKPSISLKSLKLNPKDQIKKIKSLVSLNMHQLSKNQIKVKKLLRKSSIYKGRNSQISEFQKDFNTNFSILDIDKTQMLNYSRFCILLQSLFFIGSPSQRTKEERSLVLKAWKIISDSERKVIWKGNAFTLLLAVMNLYDKSIQTHNDASGFGKMVNGIYCLKKEEIKTIHKTFSIFFRNRHRTFSSTSPENRAVLKKNLSFEEKNKSFSPTQDLTIRKTLSNSILQNSIIEKTIESHSEEISEVDQFTENSRVVEIKELDSSKSSELGLKGRLRIRLSTSIVHSRSFGLKLKEKLHRSITLINKQFSNFEENDSKSKDGEDLSL